MPSSTEGGAPQATKKRTTKKTVKKTAVKKTTVKKKATRKAAAKPASGVGRLRVRQVRSTIQRPKTFKRTLEALGIRHHQDEVVVNDTPAIQGMLRKVRHLVSIAPEE